MSIDAIKKSLEERFNQPLPEYYERRIVFWKDEENRFTQEIDEIELEGVKILKLTGTNNFYAKKLLLSDDTTSNYLVYDPCSYESQEDKWLLDIELYSGEPFYADKMSLQMDEFDIDSTPEMRKAVKAYPKFFDNKERREKLKSFGKSYTNATELHFDILCVLCGIDSGNSQDIISAVLINGLDESENKCIEQITKFGNISLLWTLIQKTTGFIPNADGNNLEDLAAHIVFSAASQTMGKGALKEYSNYISDAHSSFCYSIVHDLMRSDDADIMVEICEEIEYRFNLIKRFTKLEINELVECDIFPCINEVIVTKYFAEIRDNVIKADDIIKVTEKRKSQKGYDNFKSYFDGLYYIAKMQQFYHEHLDEFHIAEVYKVWKAYTTELYLMDTYYRMFHLAFGNALKDMAGSDLDDLFKNAADYVETLYQNWYLKDLTKMWLNVADEHLLGISVCTSILPQTKFYQEYVSKTKDKTTAFVIISDALRYEVAVELSRTLEVNNRGTVSISSMQSVFPSITKYGMAALLCGKKKTVDTNGDILVDGMKCQSTEQRNAVLCSVDVDSVAVQYKDFIAMKKPERNELIKGKKVVYIYHNQIDALGDKAPTETKVFEACEDTIKELSNLVQIIAGLRASSQVIITADHGFNYTYSPLNESQKISKADLSGVKEAGRRYVVGTDKTISDLLIPVNMEINTESNELKGLAPRDIVRIKMSGGGENFVHGGISLQECVVPVIEFKNIRLSSKKFQANKEAFISEPVELNLLASTHKISNMLFSLYFFQKDAVGGSKTAAIYDLFFVDSYNNVISDKQRIIADKTSDDGQDRQFRCNFSLKQNKYDKNESYYLLIVDENGNEKDKIEYEIDIAFAFEDFGF